MAGRQNGSVEETVFLVLNCRLLLSLMSINLFLFSVEKSHLPVSTSDLNHKRCGFSPPEVKKKRDGCSTVEKALG